MRVILSATSIFIFLVLAIVMEMVDSSIGMMYGTILSPLLIMMGIPPVQAIPAILFSQALGGISGSLAHHKCRNFNSSLGSKDMKIVMLTVIPGMVAVILGVIVAFGLDPVQVKMYIAVLVIIMSLLCFFPIKYKFSWWKHALVGSIAAFNKAISGGGFGPVTSTGKIIAGMKPSTSIATTTLSEVFICMLAFILYILFSKDTSWVLVLALTAGALIGGIIGPFITKKVNNKAMRVLIGIFGIISGAWMIYKVF